MKSKQSYKRISRNLYQISGRYFVYAFRDGKRQFVGSFETLADAEEERDKFEAKNPARKPWEIRKDKKI